MIKNRLRLLSRLNKKLIATAAIVLVLAGILIFSAVTSPQSADLNPGPDVAIEVTDQAFVPDRIEITPGTTVIWENRGSSSHWPASNFHPTHTLYPSKGNGCIGSQFDACKGLAKGEKYSFRFEEVGRWGVHDHIYPGLTMVIEVKGGKSSSQSLVNRIILSFFTSIVTRVGSLVSGSGDLTDAKVKNFRSLDDDISAQSKIIQDISSRDPKTAWAFLKKAYVVGGNVEGNAHSFAHLIGRTIYQKFGLSGITICDETFAYGCYHGVSEKLLVDQGPQVVAEVQKECLQTLSPEKSFNYTGCLHGMGHGLLTWHAYQVSPALKDCNNLDKEYRNYCYDGVFMENANGSPNQLDPKKPWSLCIGLDEEVHDSCARYQSIAFMEKLNQTFAQAAESCFSAPVASLTKPCLSSLGYYSAQMAKGDESKIVKTCSEIGLEEGRYQCLVSAATEVRFQKYSNWENTAESICQGLPSEWKEKCPKKGQLVI